MGYFSSLFARREFVVPHFELQPLEFEPENNPRADESQLSRAITAAADSNVVAFVQLTPTPGELRASIEHHLRATSETLPRNEAPDPVEELRNALADLRRSLA